MIARVLPLALLALFAASCGPRAAEPSRLHGDSGVRVPYDADQIARRAVEAVPTRWRGHVTRSVYGRSEEGRALHAVRIAAPGVAPRDAVLMTQAIHGNEFLDVANHLPAALFGVSPELLVAAGDDLAAIAALDTTPRPAFHRFLQAGGVVYVLPVVNADGFAAWRRANATGLDLNRDFPIARYVGDPQIPAASRSAENRAFNAFLAATFTAKTPDGWSIPDATGAVRPWAKDDDAREDLRLFFDYHCCQGPVTGSLMPPWGDTPSLDEPLGIPDGDVARYRALGRHYLAVFPKDFFGTGLEAIGYVAKGTGDEYAYERYADQSLTYEGRSGGIEPRRLAGHVALWERLFASLDGASLNGASHASLR